MLKRNRANEGVTEPSVQVDLDIDSESTLKLVREAEQGNAAEQALTIRQALGKYKKATAWAMALSVCLVMDGFDTAILGALYGQTAFQRRFGVPRGNGAYAITAAWQSGLSNATIVGQLIGLTLSGYFADRIGPRKTTMAALVWMAAVVFVTFFSPSITVLCVGMVLCGTGWGAFQTMTTAYACEVVPTILRPYVTAWVCMCWGIGQIICTGTMRGVLPLTGDIAFKLPFALQWIWPVPLFIVAYFAPESPWSSVRRGRIEEARRALWRLRQTSTTTEHQIEASLALIIHTTALERQQVQGASYIDCFKGVDRRRTEINVVTWMTQLLCGNAIKGYAVTFLQEAGFSVENSFNVNISLSGCFIVGGVISWFLLTRLGRATLYIGGTAFMLVCLLIIGSLGSVPNPSPSTSMAIGVMLVLMTLCNMMTVGPVAYPIVSEIPSGRLRYKTIVIGRMAYLFTQIFTNSMTPKMIQPVVAGGWGWRAKAGFFYAGTNILCLTWCWFRLPETKDRSFGEIDVLFENKVSARKFKGTKADQFASHRDRLDGEDSKSIEEKKREIEQIEQV